MRLMKWVALPPVLLVLVACGGSSQSSSGSSPGSATSAAPSHSPSPSHTVPSNPCALLTAADLNSILAPVPAPFGEGKPTVAAPGATSKGCEWLAGPIGGKNTIDLVVAFGFYNPSTPVSTAGFEQVSGLGDDVAYFATNKYGVQVLKARKDGVVVNLTMIKPEGHDAALAHTRAIMEKLLAQV